MNRTYEYTSAYSNGTPKKKWDNKGVMIALIVSRIIIFVGIRRVFFKQPTVTEPVVKDPSELTGETVRRFIGEKVLLAWTIERTEWFNADYSHTLTTDEDRTFGVKSATVDLFAFSGRVEIKGEIADFDKELPIVQVTEIVGWENGDAGTGGNAGNEQYTYFEDQQIGFDLSISDGYDVVETDDEVKLVDTTTSPEEVLLSVSAFECIAGDPLQDCEGLLQKFAAMNSESFTSSQGITFYNLSETNTRFAFNNEWFGYTIRPSSAESLNSFIGFMQFVTDARLRSFVETWKAQCKNLDHTLAAVDEVTFEEVDTWLIEAAIEGKGQENEEMTCIMDIRLGTTRTVAATSVEAQEVEDTDDDDAQNDEEQPAEDEDDTADEENAETETGDTATTDGIPQNQTVVEKPASFDGRFEHTSARGYTVRLSDPNVSFNGVILEDPVSLGYPDTNCIYRIRFTSRQNADNVDSSPDVELYECKGTITPENAGQQNLQIVGMSGNVAFVAKYLTNNLEGFQVYVE